MVWYVVGSTLLSSILPLAPLLNPQFCTCLWVDDLRVSKNTMKVVLATWKFACSGMQDFSEVALLVLRGYPLSDLLCGPNWNMEV